MRSDNGKLSLKSFNKTRAHLFNLPHTRKERASESERQREGKNQQEKYHRINNSNNVINTTKKILWQIL